MKTYDLAVIWEWDYDKPLNHFIEEYAYGHNLSVTFINPLEILKAENEIINNEISFKWYLDRASETDVRFLPLIQKCLEKNFQAINSPANVHKALNKSYMHRLLLSSEIPLPETLILPSYAKKQVLPFFTFEKIGIPFVIKPSNGGGGDGVHMGLTELSQVENFRKEFPDQEYLIQQTIIPKYLEDLPLWLRVFHVCDEIFLSFWNPKTKHFSLIQQEEKLPHELITRIKHIVTNIARISKLRLFSTEIAVQTNGEPIVIDYVNDPVDLRPKSLHLEGVPDDLLKKIITSFVKFIAN